MSNKIEYTGIGSNYKNPEKCKYDYKEFIKIINDNKHLFFYNETDIPIPIVNENNFTMKELQKLVKWCGANFL